MTANRDTAQGLAATAGAFAFWGFIPLYWKLLAHLPATEVLAHRIAWSLPCLLVLVAVGRRGRELVRVLGSSRTRWLLLASTLLITVNWLCFLWAVSHDRVLDSSLGYYINPLVSVFLGFVFLGERLRRPQWAAVALAAGGVLLLTARHGLPWISLALAFSFGTYGLVRKVADAPPMLGLLVEIALLTPVTVGYLSWLRVRGDGAFAAGDLTTTLLLAAAGPVTVVPLLFFADGIRKLTLATVGFLQYMTPTGHFILAVAVFGEPFDATHLAAFACIWTALGLYSYDLKRRLAPRSGR
ncbi:MAG: EamA family transporter RarD [Acidobacteria bacterium]|nr:EamA family transporter RarD [Acidobacteriota bacterium]